MVRGGQTGSATFYRNKTDDSSGTIVKEDWLKHDLEPAEPELFPTPNRKEHQSRQLGNSYVRLGRG